MRTIFFFLLLISSSIATAQSDTLWIGTPQTDALQDTLIDCYPYRCNPDSSHTYYCPTAYNGVLDIFGSDGIVYEILIVTEGQYVVVDTCATLWSFAGGQLNLPFAYPSGFEVIVNGPEGAWVMIESKVDPIQAYDSLPAPVIDLTALCPTSVAEPVSDEAGGYYYVDPETFIRTLPHDFKPEYHYLKRD